MDYPYFVVIKGKKYNINTSYKIAIQCNEIAMDENINEYEKGLAIICKLFGKDALDDEENLEGLLSAGVKFLRCGNDEKGDDNSKIDMDYTQDMPFIKASFRSDYGVNLNTEDIHWWEFFELLNGLSNSEFGNCCVLNRIRALRNMDTSKISDAKLKKEIENAKEQFRIKRNLEQASKKEFTKEQKENIDRFYKETGIERGE